MTSDERWHWAMPTLIAVLLVLLGAVGLSAGDAVPVNQAAPKADAKKARAARQAFFREAMLDHFVMGVNAPKEWHADVRQNNGACFEFSNDYLSGGVGFDTPWFFKYSTFVENSILE